MSSAQALNDVGRIKPLGRNEHRFPGNGPLAATGVDVSVAPAHAFAALVRADSTRYGNLVRDLGLCE